MSLKKTIENTLINNLEVELTWELNGDVYPTVKLESIERCSDYIAQEMKESLKDFGKYLAGYYIMFTKGEVEDKDLYQIVDKFIADRYKEEKQ